MGQKGEDRATAEVAPHRLMCTGSLVRSPSPSFPVEETPYR